MLGGAETTIWRDECSVPPESNYADNRAKCCRFCFSSKYSAEYALYAVARVSTCHRAP